MSSSAQLPDSAAAGGEPVASSAAAPVTLTPSEADSSADNKPQGARGLVGFRAGATRFFHSRELPERTSDEASSVDVELAPEIPAQESQPLLPKLMPLVMVVGVLGSIIWMAKSGGRMSPMMLMFPVMMLASAGTMISSSLGGGNAMREIARRRQEYLRYLADLDEDREELHELIRKEETLRFPHPDRYRAYLNERYLWSVRQDDDSFLCFRVGSGSVSSDDHFAFPELPRVEDLEPVSVSALRLFSRTANTIEDMPIVVSLRGFSRCVVSGEKEKAHSLFRSMLMTFFLTHHPEDCHVVLACRDPQWPELLKWLPHTVRRSDCELYPFNLLHQPFDLREDLPQQGTTLLITDSVEFVSAYGSYFPHVLAILPEAEHTETDLHLEVDDEGVVHVWFRGESCPLGTADQLSPSTAAAIAWRLAGYTTIGSPAEDSGDDANGEKPTADLFELLGMGSVENFLPERDWALKVGRDRLRVPIGLNDQGRSVYLDLKESAQGGMGPHGLCIGATGSGKSELLRTLVVGLIGSHSPEQVNLVLVDFKGGATFSGISGAPHVAAVITNLSDDALAVERMYAALEGELRRRQEILHAAGGFANIDEYVKARSRGQVDTDRFPHLPALLIIVDEFSELLAERPEFAELFVQIGRLGRSLHVHLLLASQRIDAGKLRGLESHLSYRIALKTFSVVESRSVIGTPDAFNLPQQPGAGYLLDGTDNLQKFRAFYVSGTLKKRSQRRVRAPQEILTEADNHLQIYGSEPLVGNSFGWSIETRNAVPIILKGEEVEEPTQPADSDGEEHTIFHVLLNSFPSHVPRAHQVWLPPLPLHASAAECAELAIGASVGTTMDELSHRGIVGLIDVPAEQMRKSMRVSLPTLNHALIVGTTQTGKSQALVTIASALAQENSPAILKMYAVDAGGGVLTHLRILPHCAAVCSTQDEEIMERTFAEISQELRNRMAGAPINQHIVLFIDGWAALVENNMEFEEKVRQLVREGLSYNIHLVLAASRWGDIRAALRDSLTTRWELRLGDPADSILGRKNAEKVPALPGRGMTPDGLHFLFALQDEEGLRAIAAQWSPEAPVTPLALLPRIVSAGEMGPVTVSGKHGYRIPLGIEGDSLGQFAIDTGQEENILVVGDSSGKSTMLRTVIHRIAENIPATEAKMLVVDYRRQLLGECLPSHLAGYASTKQDVQDFIAQLTPLLESRMPAGVNDPQTLRDRSWWEGPDIFLIVDDYDLVATSSGNPLLGLLELLPYGRDIGLHMVVARRCTGFSRTSFEPIMSRIRELHPTVFVMNGSPEEGAIAGGRKARSLPAGRADVINSQGQHQVVQLAYLPVEENAE